MTGLPSRSTVIGTAVPAGTAAISAGTSVLGVTLVSPILRSTSRTWSLPSAGIPWVTLDDLDRRMDRDVPSWVRAAATAESWEVTISTWPCWVSCCWLPLLPYWAKKG